MTMNRREHPCLKRIRSHGLRVQTIKAYASDRAATETGSKNVTLWLLLATVSYKLPISHEVVRVTRFISRLL
jgi:hypothetical protein